VRPGWTGDQTPLDRWAKACETLQPQIALPRHAGVLAYLPSSGPAAGHRPKFRTLLQKTRL